MLIAGNWKMFKGPSEAAEFCRGLRDNVFEGIGVVVCPPFVSLQTAVQLLAGTEIGVAAQNVHWEPEGAEPVDSCTIIVTTANDLVSQIHDRMPVILAPQDYEQWLDPEVHDPEKVISLLKPYPENEMEAYPVSFSVNSPKNEGWASLNGCKA